jgi:hypothetical protein
MIEWVPGFRLWWRRWELTESNAKWLRSVMLKSTRTINALRRKLDAISWAKSQPDLDLAEDQLDDELRKLRNEEDAAWDQFRRTWKPGILKRAQMAYEGYSPENYCRDEFLRKWQRERQWDARAKLDAVRSEQESIRKRRSER